MIHCFSSVLIMGMFLLAIGCDRRATAPPPPSDAQSSPRGGTVVIGTIGDADSLLPLNSVSKNASDIFNHNLYLPLMSVEPDLRTVTPVLATGHTFSPDRKTLTMKLRSDVQWTDGTPTTAEDVAFSFKISKDPRTSWSGRQNLMRIESVEAVDPSTVRVTFHKPYFEPFQLLDATVFPVMPKHLLEKIPVAELRTCRYNTEPITNGPFKLSKWVRQQFIELVPNPSYRGTPPRLDKVVFKVVPDNTALFLQLRNGEIDFLEKIPPEKYEEAKRLSTLQEFRFESNNYTFIGWNLSTALFSDRKVRQALTMAIPRELIVERILRGLGKVVHGPIHPLIWGYTADVPRFEYDPTLEKPKALLASAGWKDTDWDGVLEKDGIRFEFAIKTNKGNTVREAIAEIVQAELAKVGVRANPQLLEWTTFIDDADKRNFQAMILGWATGLKPELRDLWHSSALNDKFNFVGYSNPEVDKLIDAAEYETDETQLKASLAAAQRLITEDQPYTFLYSIDSINFASARLRGYTPHPRYDLFRLFNWTVASTAP